MGETPAQRKRREKKERSAAARERAQKAAPKRKAKATLRRLFYPALAVALVAVVFGVSWLLNADRRNAANRLGDLVVSESSQGREHVASASIEAAPTSGNHDGAPVCGTRGSPVPVDSQIHALEHGAIAIQYRPDDIDAADVELAEAFATSAGEGVLVAPNPDLDSPVVVTAWTKRMRLETMDLTLIDDFATAFRGQGPESVPCEV